MNFLAHLLLDHSTPGCMIGSILPDLVRPIPFDTLPDDIASAARRHRRIDALVDTHPLHLAARARLRAEHNHFSAILVDVFYDHILAVEFADYSACSLDHFVTDVYAAFTTHQQLMPDPMPMIVRRMIAENWLGSYAMVPGMHARLSQMSHRFSSKFGRTFDPALAIQALQRDHICLSRELATLWPILAHGVSTDVAACSTS